MMFLPLVYRPRKLCKTFWIFAQVHCQSTADKELSWSQSKVGSFIMEKGNNVWFRRLLMKISSYLPLSLIRIKDI